ncbi:MAG: hypothetical protein V7K88_20395 [Nostoc sp.]|uniref:hypothetical protein n=1 Tax=Nostoc sp. TaxID=1180 RepID=UPI002FF68C90
MKSYYQDIKTRMAKYGRNPDTCKILPAVMPFVGETETIAQEKQAFHNELVHPMAGLLTMSNHLGVDLSQYSLDQSVEKVEAQDYQKLLAVVQRLSLDKTITLRDLGKIYGRSLAVPQLVGTPIQIADKLEALFHEQAGDGFVISPAYLPGSFDEFVDLVIPELQKHGLFRKEYTGNTLRDSLGLN